MLTILFPLVILCTFIGNCVFFNAISQFCLSISSALLASFLTNHVALFVGLWTTCRFQLWLLYPFLWNTNLRFAPFGCVTFLTIPTVSIVATHWLPTFLASLMTPLLGKVWVYVVGSCNLRAVILPSYQRALYLLCGFLLTQLLVHSTLFYFHPSWF